MKNPARGQDELPWMQHTYIGQRAPYTILDHCHKCFSPLAVQDNLRLCKKTYVRQ